MRTVSLVVASDPIVLEERIVQEMNNFDPASEELRVFDLREDEVSDLVAMLSQAPMFVSRFRILVRSFEALKAEDAPFLAEGFTAMADEHIVVLFSSDKRLPKALSGLKDPVLEKVELTVGKEAERRSFISSVFAAAGVRLTNQAIALVTEHAGVDLSQVNPLAQVLAGLQRGSDSFDVADIRPYLGQAREVPLWTLTDAIERGELGKAMAVLERLLAAQKAPQLLITVLQRRYLDMVVLVSPGVRSLEQAKAALDSVGARKPPDFALRNMLSAARRLNYHSAVTIVSWLADAARDLRGESLLDADAVLQLLVARMTRLFVG
ncbi:DNA polymerase III subunit delta [Ferrimicrobium acidiphilum]|jgi:DNA polymerase III delta subunit|uniref:DNA-directed DNA polymerase n=1 Tax=Ferrimicrobium acidiphilum DSM 19497 TaxID=1121877 RepID=A0A0D8FV29_9ACTN|nr:hypothetical protein [Ferrimicrobium acidiphilum]KJE76784.1 DNA polymerase III subunit delta [Ferrimicrobium acidiphilum DSM 19497]MCL5053540.1 hypothetical protein [Gammaproteobacteria bacterium]